MKVTPLEIRQKSFEKVFRGYDKDEVTAFLQTLSQEWERMVDEYKEMKFKLEASQEEVRKLREVESSLFKTLKTAEDTGTNMIDQAKKTADLHMRETQMKAEAVISESKSKAKSLLENAEHKSRQIIESMEDEVKSLEQTYKALENYRDNLIADLKNMATNALEKAERAHAQRDRFAIENQISKARRISDSFKNQEPFEEDEEFTVSSSGSAADASNASKETVNTDSEEKQSMTEDATANPEKKRDDGSFFDQIN